MSNIDILNKKHYTRLADTKYQQVWVQDSEYVRMATRLVQVIPEQRSASIRVGFEITSTSSVFVDWSLNFLFTS